MEKQKKKKKTELLTTTTQQPEINEIVLKRLDQRIVNTLPHVRNHCNILGFLF